VGPWLPEPVDTGAETRRQTAVSARRAVPPAQAPLGGDLWALRPATEQPALAGAGR
jgi:hypothetical protein